MPPRRPAFRLTAPQPEEIDLQVAVADLLNALVKPPAEWWPMPVGHVQLAPAQAARLSRIGVKRGYPDIFVLFEGRLWGIELKRRGGRLSKTRIARTRRGSPRLLEGQEDVFPRLLAAGVAEIAVCDDVDQVVTVLRRWKIPLRGIIQPLAVINRAGVS